MADKSNGQTKPAGKWAPSWLRRVVPAGYEKATLFLEGTSPLLMNSGEVDREGPEYRAYYLLGQKKRKSLDDDARLRELEWSLGIYLDADLGPFVPGKNVKELLREAATKWSKGEEIKRSLAVLDYRVPVLYEGPRDQAGLWADSQYRYLAMVRNSGRSGGRVVRCRPKFDQWAIAAEIAFDPEDLDFDLLCLVAERAQKYGFGDYRPEFGSFTATLVRGELKKAISNGSALKPVVKALVEAHAALVGRVMVDTG